MKSVYVIEFKDLDNTKEDTDILGVATTKEKALEMCEEYFGEHEEISFENIDEFYVEWKRKWKVKGLYDEYYETLITLRWFQLDNI